MIISNLRLKKGCKYTLQLKLEAYVCACSHLLLVSVITAFRDTAEGGPPEINQSCSSNFMNFLKHFETDMFF